MGGMTLFTINPIDKRAQSSATFTKATRYRAGFFWHCDQCTNRVINPKSMGSSAGHRSQQRDICCLRARQTTAARVWVVIIYAALGKTKWQRRIPCAARSPYLMSARLRTLRDSPRAGRGWSRKWRPISNMFSSCSIMTSRTMRGARSGISMLATAASHRRKLSNLSNESVPGGNATIS
jgi:hypothetical protein